MPAVVPIHRLAGRVLGLVGFGNIPRALAPKAKAFGLRVVTHDPYAPPQALAAAGVEGVSFDRLLEISDFVSIHAPLMPATRGLVQRRGLRQDEDGRVADQHRARTRWWTKMRWSRRSIPAASAAPRSTWSRSSRCPTDVHG
jgi:Lactate dehydrogenase and related dehydrogenases